MAALFQPFRALGYITEDTPFVVQRLGAETFVAVSVGKAWQVISLLVAQWGQLLTSKSISRTRSYAAKELQYSSRK